MVVPLLIGTLSAVPIELELHLQQLDISKITIGQIQKATLLGSANIIRKGMKKLINTAKHMFGLRFFGAL